MKSKIDGSVFSIIIAALLLFMPFQMLLAAEEDALDGVGTNASSNAVIKSKDEVIYATLASDGSVHAVYAVNHFVVAAGGSINDFGDYTSLQNLTDTTPVTLDGDVVSMQANVENFYYQGDLASTDLPWIFHIEYFLDGVKTTAQALAGESGELEIHILTKQNGKLDATFYNNYVLQITATLDVEKNSDIEAPGATVASAGGNKAIVYTIMPGSDADISLRTQVKDFSMAGIDISAMPFSMNMELPDTDSMVSDFNELADAIFALNDGVSDLTNGVAELKSGADQLKTGSSDIKAALSELDDNSDQLVQSSSQISGALTQIASFLGSSTAADLDLSELAALPQGLTELADSLDVVAGSLLDLQDGFASAHTALAEAIKAIPNATISQAQIAALYAHTDPIQHRLLDKLIASYAIGQTVKTTYSEVNDTFEAVSSTLETLPALISSISTPLDEMSAEMSEALSGLDVLEQFPQLSMGMSLIDKGYASFHDGLEAYLDGVGELASGYADFDNGLASLTDGFAELHDGVVALHDGTTELRDETANMPDMIQTGINDLLDPYTGAVFEPISFTSPKNAHTSLVQFIFKSDAIETPAEPLNHVIEPSQTTFWDRLLALFTGDEEE